MIRLSIFFILLYSLSSCGNKGNSFDLQIDGKDAKVVLENASDTTYTLNLLIADSIYSTWKLDYPVYRFDYGDVTGDGVEDIAVGVMKTTRFDLNYGKRLFLFKITEGMHIRPLWLGSRVAQPLEDFKVIRTASPAKIRTIEKEKSGKFLVAEYKWKGFGLEFTNYIKREITIEEAKKILKLDIK